MARILVADDERSMREFLEIFLEKEGYEVVLAESASKALQCCEREPLDLVITDLKLGHGSGLDVLAGAKRLRPGFAVIMKPAFAPAENAIQAMKLGAYDYITKPFKVDELAVVVSKALEKRALVAENRE